MRNLIKPTDVPTSDISEVTSERNALLKNQEGTHRNKLQ